jgi:hypothetical protein
MAAVDEFIVEVALGHLKFVKECSTAELVAAGLLLVLADDVPDTIWAGRYQVVEAALTARCDPTRGAKPMTEAQLVIAGLKTLPFEVREQIGPRLRAGITARDEAQLCR